MNKDSDKQDVTPIQIDTVVSFDLPTHCDISVVINEYVGIVLCIFLSLCWNSSTSNKTFRSILISVTPLAVLPCKHVHGY